MSQLDGLMRELGKLSPAVLDEIDKIIYEGTSHMALVPTVGPQYEAYYHPADEIYMGGSAGGGKSALAIGLALNEHEKSLMLRRHVDDAKEFAEETLEILGNRDGYNGQDKILRLGSRRVRWGGCNEERDKQRYKGKPNDLIVFDEIPDFLESQYLFITAWNRSKNPKQRCRVLCTGNPPTEAAGLWVIRRWAAWLDPRHPKPAESGEIRWFVRMADDRDIEVDGPGEYDDGTGRMVKSRSRTFIRARLQDNPDLTQTDDYERALDALPEEYRTAYRDGRFDLALKADPKQVIPTAWVQAAQERWQPTPPYGIPMCAIGVDGARVGDKSVRAPRHDGWYAPLLVLPGIETPTGRELAGQILTTRRDSAIVIIDCLETVGSQAYAHLRDNEIECFPFRGNDASVVKEEHKQFGFYNRRAEAHWKFREALDPGQDGGSTIALPDDPELVADLTAPTFKMDRLNGCNVVKLLSKEDTKKKLGRSPDKGDAVVMSWYKGARAMTHITEWRPDNRVGRLPRKRMPKANMGRRR